MNVGKITVVNKYHYKGEGISIMRGSSPLGNPYPVAQYSREESIRLYRTWLRDQYAHHKDGLPYRELMRLANIVQGGCDIVLICCCKPKACHGDIVKQAIEGIIKQSRR